jgi:mycoredoxin-dependent peroxiredoxin
VSTVELGQVAPRFVLRNQHGQDIDLEKLRGHPVLVIFYPFAFTGICTRELAAVQEGLQRFREAGARTVAISTDTMFTLRVFAEQEGYAFDLLSDHWPHGAIANTYGVFDAEAGCALRGTFVLDAEGVITWRTVNGIGETRDLADVLDRLAA